MIYREDLNNCFSQVGKKSSFSPWNSLLYEFLLGICLWLNPSWEWGISVWPELSGIKWLVIFLRGCSATSQKSLCYWTTLLRWSILKDLLILFFLLKHSSNANCMLTRIALHLMSGTKSGKVLCVFLCTWIFSDRP